MPTRCMLLCQILWEIEKKNVHASVLDKNHTHTQKEPLQHILSER